VKVSSPNGVADGLDSTGLWIGTDADAEPLGVGDRDSTEHPASARLATRSGQDPRFMTSIG
jgi:hypothetical protein